MIFVLLSIPDVGQIDAFAEPWRRIYTQSPLLSTVILFGHLGGLFAAGGLAVASDQATLRLDVTNVDDRRRHLADLARARRPTWIALAVALASGLLLFLADVEAFAASPIFWAKMVLVALLIANALLSARLDETLRREDASALGHESDEAPRWRRRRAGSVVNAVLWFGLLFLGTALASR